MPARKRKDASGRLLKKGEKQCAGETGYEYRWTDRFGKRHSVYARELEELRKIENEIEFTNGLLKDGNVKDITLNQLYSIWKIVKKGLKPNSFNNYKYMYEKFVMDSFGKSKVVDIKRSDIKAFYNSLYDSGLKPETITNAHIVIHQLLDLAVEDMIIQINPSDHAMRDLMMAHAREGKRVKALTHEEEALFISYLYNSEEYRQYYPIFVTMMMEGMRVGEATALQWSDIDFEHNLINIDKTLVNYRTMEDHKNSYHVHSTKTKNGKRMIEMIGMVRQALMMEKEYQKEQGITCSSNIDGYDDFIFLNSTGHVYPQTTLNLMLKKIAGDCNKEILEKAVDEDPVLLPAIHCHMLRHTFGTRLNDAGVNIKAMQALMGHGDYETTLQTYVDPSARTLKRATEEYQQMMSNIFQNTGASG